MRAGRAWRRRELALLRPRRPASASCSPARPVIDFPAGPGVLEDVEERPASTLCLRLYGGALSLEPCS